MKVFFLACVLVAGLYGAATASRKILFIQALPAAIGLLLLGWPEAEAAPTRHAVAAGLGLGKLRHNAAPTKGSP